MKQTDFHHIPVLLQEAVAALSIRPDGIYLDCTAGGGGHSSAILQKLQNGRLLAVDRDPQAIATLRQRFAGDVRVTIIHGNFFAAQALLQTAGVMGVHGILADLGVSSHQLDCADRGFSLHREAPLDMRMSCEGTDAADAVNTLSPQMLRDILYRYGEEKFAPRIVSAIVREREKTPIRTTVQLAELVKSAVPAAARRDGHPARQTFQALRIYVNHELDGLDTALDGLFACLQKGGRCAVITFHSLEDRIVKQNFARHCKGCDCPPDFPVCVCNKKPQGRLPGKAFAPGKEEVEQNPRSRSARLRVIERL